MVRTGPNYQSWTIDAAEFPAAAGIAKKIAFVCRYGLLAPSVHNTQPWQFSVKRDRLVITVPPPRRLAAGDPTGRELWLSLGACVQNLVVAGRHFGLQAKVLPLKPEAGSLTLVWSQAKPKPNAGLVAAISQRVTNRAPYQARPIAADNLVTIAKSYRDANLAVVVSDDQRLINQLAELSGRAIGLALSNPAFRRELAGLLRPNWTTAHDGIPGFSTEISTPRSAIEATLMRHGQLAKRQAAKEQETMRRSAAVVLVFSRGDTPPHWLTAGRAYQHCALVATSLGISQATSAATVEAADYHLDIENTCRTKFRLQTVMRLGYGPPRHHSPRRQLTDVLT